MKNSSLFILLVCIIRVSEVRILFRIGINGEFVLYDALIVILAHGYHTHDEVVVFEHGYNHSEHSYSASLAVRYGIVEEKGGGEEGVVIDFNSVVLPEDVHLLLRNGVGMC